MLVKKIDDLDARPVEMEGAEKCTVRVIFGPKDRAPMFSMRQFDIGTGGHTPHHSHLYEHQVIVLQGDIVLVSEVGKRALTVGDAAMVMPGEKHQFRNSGNKPAKMICIIPIIAEM